MVCYCLTSSTRRFLARPFSVPLSSMGWSGPKPPELKRPEATFAATSALTTAAARGLARGRRIGRECRGG